MSLARAQRDEKAFRIVSVCLILKKRIRDADGLPSRTVLHTKA